MTFNKVIIEVLDKELPRIKRKSWDNKKLQVEFPNSFVTLVLNNKNNIIDTFYSFSEGDLLASDWEVTE